MSNLIDLITQQVTPEVLGQLTKMTGEDETQIVGAVDAVVPTLVGGALSKSATPAGAEALLAAIGSLGPLDNFASLLGGGDAMHNLLTQGGGIVSSLFGANANQIANGVNSAAAIHGDSASILMYAVAPLTLSVVGQTLGADNLNPTALTTLLADQRQSVQAALPAGLGSLLGFSAPEPARAPIAAKVEPAPVPAATKAAPPPAPKPAVTGTVPPPPPPPSRSIWRWLGPLLILLLLGGLLWWFLLRPQTGTVPPAAATPAPAAATNTPVAAEAPLTPTVAAESTTVVTATTTNTDTTATDTTPTDTTATDTTPTDTAGVTTTDSLTPTAAAADTTTVTTTAATTSSTTATDTAGVTATDSVTPTAAAEANNAALCTALAQLDLVLGAAPAITTTTPVTDVRRLVGNAGIVITAVSTAAEGVSGVDLGATAAAVQDLTAAADGLTGDTVGAAADPVATSLNSVRDSYAELNTAAGCP